MLFRDEEALRDVEVLEADEKRYPDLMHRFDGSVSDDRRSSVRLKKQIAALKKRRRLTG